ncbi:MAG: chemotaxis protein CheW [Bacteroidota bacterium]|nr:chemotaxis protein CheW [Bacteroidota bacterium]
MQDSTNALSYLFIKLNRELYAVNSHDVVEVCEVPNMIKVPGSPEYLRGLVMYKKQYIPVVDLRVKLNMPKASFTVNTCLVIYQRQIYGILFQLGILADALHEVKEFEPQKYPIENDIMVEGKVFKAIQKEDKGKVLIINLESIFSVEEITNLSSIISSTSM